MNATSTPAETPATATATAIPTAAMLPATGTLQIGSFEFGCFLNQAEMEVEAAKADLIVEADNLIRAAEEAKRTLTGDAEYPFVIMREGEWSRKHARYRTAIENLARVRAIASAMALAH